MRTILPSITTHGCDTSTWRTKIDEIDSLGIAEVALFVTGLSGAERAQCYKELEGIKASSGLGIPFVHAVSAMPEQEYAYLIETFGTERFNLHPAWEYPLEHPLSNDIRERIFIENSNINSPLKAQDLEGFGGICFDLSHLEDSRLSAPMFYLRMLTLAAEFPVGANHISAIAFTSTGVAESRPIYSSHEAASEEEFEYLRGLPPHCFATLCAVEVENPLSEQVSFIKRIREELQRAESTAPFQRAAGLR